MIFLDQFRAWRDSGLLWGCFILIHRQKITSNGFFLLRQSGQRTAFVERFWNKKRFICSTLFRCYIKRIESMLPFVCSVIDHKIFKSTLATAPAWQMRLTRRVHSQKLPLKNIGLSSRTYGSEACWRLMLILTWAVVCWTVTSCFGKTAPLLNEAIIGKKALVLNEAIIVPSRPEKRTNWLSFFAFREKSSSGFEFPREILSYSIDVFYRQPGQTPENSPKRRNRPNEQQKPGKVSILC